jgi:DNA-directed RNA polymerase specialized sigma24 family protein
VFEEIITKGKIERYVSFFAWKISERYKNSFEFEDVKQDLLLYLYESYDRYYDSNRGSLETFLKYVLKRKAADFLNITRTQGKKLFYEEGHLRDAEFDPVYKESEAITFTGSDHKFTVITCEDMRNAYTVVVRRLEVCDSTQYKHAVGILKYIQQGYQAKDIADKLGISRQYVSIITRQILIPELKKEFCYNGN